MMVWCSYGDREGISFWCGMWWPFVISNHVFFFLCLSTYVLRVAWLSLELQVSFGCLVGMECIFHHDKILN